MELIWRLHLISQNRAGQSSYYIYDGLGSTRQLSDITGAISDSYDYDAFGILLESTGDTENSYRYTGEQFDEGLGQYYLRARYYNQGIGRFTQMDTWMGRSQDPVTLHKYLYAAGNPVMYTDPSGHMPSPYESRFGQEVDDYVCDQYKLWSRSLGTQCDSAIKYNFAGDVLKPDIFDVQNKRYAEVKPLSINGISTGILQMNAYDQAFGKAGFSREIDFFPSPTIIEGKKLFFLNNDGVIFYTDTKDEAKALSGLMLTSMSRRYKSFWRGRSLREASASSFSTTDKILLAGIGAALTVRGIQASISGLSAFTMRFGF